jgi:hypothetical protein
MKEQDWKKNISLSFNWHSSMAVYSLFFKSGVVVVAIVGAVSAQSLNPVQDIVLPCSASASSPLEWLGANGPWFAGMFL